MAIKDGLDQCNGRGKNLVCLNLNSEVCLLRQQWNRSTIQNSLRVSDAAVEFQGATLKWLGFCTPSLGMELDTPSSWLFPGDIVKCRHVERGASYRLPSIEYIDDISYIPQAGPPISHFGLIHVVPLLLFPLLLDLACYPIHCLAQSP